MAVRRAPPNMQPETRCRTLLAPPIPVRRFPYMCERKGVARPCRATDDTPSDQQAACQSHLLTRRR